MAETKKQDLSAAHQALVKDEMALRGVKFLPTQVIKRLTDPKADVQTLGSARRHKATLIAKRAAAAKAPAPAATPTPKAVVAPKAAAAPKAAKK